MEREREGKKREKRGVEGSMSRRKSLGKVAYAVSYPNRDRKEGEEKKKGEGREK